MKTGTKSVLFGVHQFIWHPITVWLAWKQLYGTRPTWRESICIVIHDWGYLGCENMDDANGELHPELGAKIARCLFGNEYHDLVLLHSRHLAHSLNREPSKLCWPDKLSVLYEPAWFYLLRARLSGEIHEYVANGERFHGRRLTHLEWFTWLKGHLNKVAKERIQSIRGSCRGGFKV